MVDYIKILERVFTTTRYKIKIKELQDFNEFILYTDKTGDSGNGGAIVIPYTKFTEHEFSIIIQYLLSDLNTL